jgi:hypothetical protein
MWAKYRCGRSGAPPRRGRRPDGTGEPVLLVRAHSTGVHTYAYMCTPVCTRTIVNRSRNIMHASLYTHYHKPLNEAVTARDAGEVQWYRLICTVSLYIHTCFSNAQCMGMCVCIFIQYRLCVSLTAKNASQVERLLGGYSEMNI